MIFIIVQGFFIQSGIYIHRRINIYIYQWHIWHHIVPYIHVNISIQVHWWYSRLFMVASYTLMSICSLCLFGKNMKIMFPYFCWYSYIFMIASYTHSDIQRRTLVDIHMKIGLRLNYWWLQEIFCGREWSGQYQTTTDYIPTQPVAGEMEQQISSTTKPNLRVPMIFILLARQCLG